MEDKQASSLNQSDNDNLNDVDVEIEDVNGVDNNNEITNPFNPNEIDVDIATVNLGSLIEQLENEEIDLKPDFQRAADVWDATKKSRLIESVLLGLPLPSFYFSEDAVTKKLIVIDGLQRLCAFTDFILKKEGALKLQKVANDQYCLKF